jgi:Flp pilus assembly pilin Flp
MAQLMTTFERLSLRTEGQDLLEYGLLAALIAVVAVAGVTALGVTVNATFWQGVAQAI